MQEKLHKLDSSPSLAETVNALFVDVQTLVRQEVALARTEAKGEIDKLKSGVAWLFVGGLVGIASVVLVGLALAYFLGELTSSPLSVTFFMVAVLFGATAVGVCAYSRKKFRSFHPVPEKTVNSLKESVQWIKKQV